MQWKPVESSRNEKSFSERYPSISEALTGLPDETIVDGEIVAFDTTGRPAFNELQNYDPSNTPLAYYLFDVPHLAGRSLVDRPFSERRQLLHEKVMSRLSKPILVSEDFDGPADRVVQAVKM
jgi:bifunctional non-homologous end joining protein LigD